VIACGGIGLGDVRPVPLTSFRRDDVGVAARRPDPAARTDAAARGA